MAKSKAPAAKAAAKDNGAAATNGGDKPIRNLYLVDGSGYLFRAYHALPPMTRPDGVPINAVYGFCRMLVADLLDKPEVDHIAMILDAGEVTFRNEIYDKYKANRPPPPEDLIPQFPLIREAARAFNVTVCELKGYEADDLIATYARLAVEAGATCTIVSSDKDLMQLIRPGVELMDPIKKTKLGPEAVMEKFGVTPDKVIDVQALAGDSTDNVPGVPGIGVKTAAQLINEYGDLETLLSARRRDQAAQAARGAAAECRAGAHLAQAGHAQGRRADAGRARGLRQEEARSQRAAALAGAAGLQEPSGALHRRAGRGDGARRPGGTGRKTRPARAGDQACAGGARQIEPALHRRRLRADHRRGGARRVDRRGHARRHGRLRLRDRCARRPATPVWSACRSPCSKARGATSTRPSGARPTCRSAIARPAPRRRARSTLPATAGPRTPATCCRARSRSRRRSPS